MPPKPGGCKGRDALAVVALPASVGGVTIRRMSARRVKDSKQPDQSAARGRSADGARSFVKDQQLRLLPRGAESWRYTAPCLVILIAAVFLAFRPALQNELVHWDDDTNLMDNAFIRSFSAENLKRMWKEQVLGVWQPLTWMITALEYRLFNGADLKDFSRGLHAANIGLHAVASVITFFVIRRLIAAGARERSVSSPMALNVGALAAALLFAVHPLRVEIVAWASGQPYILAFIPCLGAVSCYLKAHDSGKWGWHLAALACLAVSLLCKAMAVPLVAALLVLDVYPLRRLGGRAGLAWPQVRRVIVEKIPYAALAGAAALLTIWATASNKTYREEEIITKVLISGFCFVFYVGLTFAPVGIAPYYMKPTPFDNSDPQFMAAALGFVLTTVALVVLRRRLPWLLAAWAAYILILLPVVGLIKHGGQLAADRYTYLACLPWMAIVGAGVAWLWSRGKLLRTGVALAGLGVLVGLGWKTAAYCRVWGDSVSLWSAMVERNPKFHMGFYNLAKAYKRPADAVWGRRADPQRVAASEELARARELFDKAANSYRQAIELYPTYPEANVDLGNMMKDGKIPGGPEGAIERYETALQGRPAFHMAHWNLAGLLERPGRYAEAEEHLVRAIEDAKRSREFGKAAQMEKQLDRVRSRMRG